MTRILLIAVAVVALILVGFIFIGGAAPTIVVAPETVLHLGPLDITNTIFTSWIVVAFLIIVAVTTGPRMGLVPSGFSGFVEAVIAAFYDMVENVVGEESARRFFPLVATIFFYILVSNYFGLLPIMNVIGVTEPGHGDTQVIMHQTEAAGLELAYIPLTPETWPPEPGVSLEEETPGEEEHAEEGEVHGLLPEEEGGDFSGIIAPYFRSVMTDVNAPLAIALFSFLFVEFWGFQSLGLGYLGKFFNFGRLLRGNPLGIIDVFVGVLELVSELSRIVSFTFRLFGNIFAGEVLLLMMTFLVPFVLIEAFYGLELFVGLIQAFVFAMLTLVFAQTAVEHHGGDEHVEAH